jgi:hypothetical protein
MTSQNKGLVTDDEIPGSSYTRDRNPHHYHALRFAGRCRLVWQRVLDCDLRLPTPGRQNLWVLQSQGACDYLGLIREEGLTFAVDIPNLPRHL